MARQFYSIDSFQGQAKDYRLLPFRFTHLDSETSVIVNDVGEHAFLGRDSLHALIRHQLARDTDLYKTLGYHLKTGHQLSLQNRPTKPHPGPDDVLPCRPPFRQVPLEVDVPSGEPGDRARGISAERFEIPLAGGAGARIVTALLAGTRRDPAWGEPSPPRLSPGGNGKGESNSMLPQASFVGFGYFMRLPVL